MSRDEARHTDDGDYEAEDNSEINRTLFSRKRKLDTVCSGSEIEFIHSSKDSIPGKRKSLPVKNEDQPSV